MRPRRHVRAVANLADISARQRGRAMCSPVPREPCSRGSRRKRLIVPTRPTATNRPEPPTLTRCFFDRNGNLCLCFLATILFFPGNAQRLVEHPIIGLSWLQFTTPSGWKLRTQTECTITIHAEKGRTGTDDRVCKPMNSSGPRTLRPPRSSQTCNAGKEHRHLCVKGRSL
jgi:hypothetical protein